MSQHHERCLQAGCPFEMDPHTLETHPGPETLGGFLRSGIAPSTTGADFLDKAIGLGKACTAHPHVVHGQGTSDRLAIFSWQRCVLCDVSSPRDSIVWLLFSCMILTQ